MKYKFRGKNIDTGEWVYGGHVVAEGRSFIYPEDVSIFIDERFIFPEEYISGFVEVIPETVGQFTGEFDEKKVKIFEGDIVRGKDGFGDIATAEVKYMGGSYYPLGEGEFYWTNIHVIGNVHDNPELIKEQK